MITGWRVRNTRFMPSSTARPSTAKSGPRWSTVGKSIARSTRSGTLVGPGICRKCRPARRVIRGILAAPSMNAPLIPVKFSGAAALAARLRKALDAEILFDRASRGRYATDASIYQLEPLGIVVPRSEEAARAALAIAAEERVPILARGAGSSQCGQAVGEALIIDHTKYLNRILEVEGERAVVQPGVVLDQLNAALRAKGLWFPVDVSTSAQATIGGMAGNNSCGSRSIAYGNMVHNVLAIDACTVSGQQWRFGPMDDPSGPSDYAVFLSRLKNLYQREKAEIEARFPKVLRKVAGYNLDHLGPPHANAAHLLVGSEAPWRIPSGSTSS